MPKNIPTPDNSGSANSQQAAQQNGLISKDTPSSPISLGNIVNGLATDSNAGLNKQASLITGVFLQSQIKKLEDAEFEIKQLLPKNAELRAENSYLRREKKRSTVFNMLGVVMVGFGTACFGGASFSTQSFIESNTLVFLATSLIIFGIILQVTVVLTSLVGSN